MPGPGGGGGPRDYNDPLLYYRMLERFTSGNNANLSAAHHDWQRAGANSINMGLVNAESGSMAVKVIKAGALTADVTRWSMFNLDIYPPAGFAESIITTRLCPVAGAFNDDTAWTIGVQQGTGLNSLQATASSFIGFRRQSTVDGNVVALLKNGADAGNETSISCGAVDPTSWHTYQLRIGANSAAAYRDGVLMGSTTDLSNINSAAAYSCHMMIYNESASGASERHLKMTLMDIIIPTGGW